MAITRPDKKSISTPPYASIRRFVSQWATPTLNAQRWRSVVRSQPVAMICRGKLISYTQSLQYNIKARRASEEEEYAAEVDYYTAMLQRANGGAGFDNLIDLLLQDGLDLPVGGNAEVLRYSPEDDVLPHYNPDGHVYDLVYMDGATISPTYSDSHPVMQQVQTESRYFSRNEVARILFTPRPEIANKGLGMAPPERIYLALNMLYQGDRYYANLLMDIPEAGILDLGDMSEESAKEWLTGLRSLLSGTDPFKVPVLYEHESTAKFIAFNRPPTEMLFDTTTEKYARLTAAGYWLTLSDVGLEKDGTLAGQIRRERAARLTGFGVVKEKVKNFFNRILPPYLEFSFIEKDEEAMIAKGKAALVMTQAVSKMVESGLMTAEDGQKMLVKEGAISVEVSALATPPPQAAPPQNDAGKVAQGEVDKILDKTSPELGGRGEITATTAKSMAVVGQSPSGDGYAEIEAINAPVRAWYNNGAALDSGGLPKFTKTAADRIAATFAKQVSELSGFSDSAVENTISKLNGGDINYRTLVVLPVKNDATGLDAMVKAMYESTVSELAAAGIDNVVLYRVVPEIDESIRLGDSVLLDIDGSLDAWTLFEDIAIRRAHEIAADGVVSMQMPIEKIFLTGRSGVECIDCGDFLVISEVGDKVSIFYLTKEIDNG